MRDDGNLDLVIPAQAGIHVRPGQNGSPLEPAPAGSKPGRGRRNLGHLHSILKTGPSGVALNPADDLAEPDAREALALAPATHDHGVTVVEERSFLPVAKSNRFLAATRQFDQR